jgi:predicted  nucleic acid-binding Zn-ribbon protein
LGEVISLSENSDDITARSVDLKTDLEAEKNRLAKFEAMYKEINDVNDKIQLTDRIFDLERRISYLEESLANQGKRVEYSTIYLQLQEERSSYANIALVRFSELVRSFVNSFNGLLQLLFLAIPYLVVGVLIWMGVRLIRKH